MSSHENFLFVELRNQRHRATIVPAGMQCNGPGLGWLFAMLLLQRPNRSQQAASGVRRVMSTCCEVTQGVGDTWATCPTLLRGTWARSRRAGFRCWSWLSAHVWLACCWDGRLPTPFSWCWALASSLEYSPSVVMSLLSVPSTASHLHQHAWLHGNQHMHTFWRLWLAGQRCRFWTEGAPGQIPLCLHWSTIVPLCFHLL